MPVRRFTIQVDERGRFVLPAPVREHLDVDGGGVIVLDVDADAASVHLRKASDVARSGRGLLRGLAPGVDLAAELIENRRAEARREASDEFATG